MCVCTRFVCVNECVYIIIAYPHWMCTPTVSKLSGHHQWIINCVLYHPYIIMFISFVDISVYSITQMNIIFASNSYTPPPTLDEFHLLVLFVFSSMILSVINVLLRCMIDACIWLVSRYQPAICLIPPLQDSLGTNGLFCYGSPAEVGTDGNWLYAIFGCMLHHVPHT